MKIKRITDRELDIMNVFWKSGEPMIASEIVAKSPELSISTVQISLKKLMEKGYLQVANIVRAVMSSHWLPATLPFRAAPIVWRP